MSEQTFVPAGLSRSVRVERGLAPAAGFERSEPTHGFADSTDFLSSIASARQEAQTMFELSQDLGVSLSLSETLSVLSMRLRRMIPYDSIAVFVNRNGWLLPELVSGENFKTLSSLKLRVGEGLCGWVAENCKPIVNGNPQVEAGYVVRMPKAYPMYDGTYKANVETMRKWLDANAPNVFPVGRNGMHKYNNQDHSMYTAMLSVENIFGADHDVWNVNVEAEYHEEKGEAGASRGDDASTAGAPGRASPTT